MHLTSFVQNTVNGLNSLLDQNGVIKILGSEEIIDDVIRKLVYRFERLPCQRM